MNTSFSRIFGALVLCLSAIGLAGSPVLAGSVTPPPGSGEIAATGLVRIASDNLKGSETPGDQAGGTSGTQGKSNQDGLKKKPAPASGATGEGNDSATGATSEEAETKRDTATGSETESGTSTTSTTGGDDGAGTKAGIKTGAETATTSKTSTEPVAIREVEPNTTAAVATKAPLLGSISGTIGKRGDVDFFRFTIAEQGQLEVSVADAPEGYDLELGAHFAAGGSWLADASERGDGRLVVDLRQPGQYVLRVRDKNSKSGADPYRLDVRFSPSGDKSEPNNSADLATVIPATTKLTGTLLPKGDLDFFLVEVDRPGQWSIEITDAPLDLLPVLGVYPAGGGSWLADRGEKGDNRLIVDLPRPGRYILKVNEQNCKRSIEPYTLDMVFTPSVDTGEPNQVAELAAPITKRGEVVATILPKGDIDMYRLEVDRHGEWTLEILDQPANHETVLGVYPAGGGSWLPDKSEKGDNLLVVDLPKPGRYFLKVSERHGKRSVEPYRLRSSFTPADDRFEPNNTAVLASPIGDIGTLTGTILPSGDVDFFAFNAPRAGTWTIRIGVAPPAMELLMGVHPAAGGSWISDKSEKGDGQLVVDLAKPGLYVLKVYAARSARSVQPYVLELAFE